MDFWSRLIGGSRSSSKTPRTTTPVERLTAFKRTCNSLQQIWRSSGSPSREAAGNLHARNCIDRLNHVLSDESRGPAPHPCLSYASTSQIFVTVTKLALTYQDEQLIGSAAVFFNTLIDAEVEGIVDNRVFSRALVDLVKRANVNSEDVESRLVELLFGVANNIRLQPRILPAWFFPNRSQSPGREGPGRIEERQFEGATRKDDFPLFYLLVDYVHREGRAGDFARTGLLYLIETAKQSKELEKWLIESDLATLMATGLGALYSQLSRHVPSPFTDGEMPTIIALSDHIPVPTLLEPPTGSDFDSFLSYMLFWQDTIDHCPSAEVNDTLLDHFQVLFLQQLLYPSLLESSDVKGGSTAAVLTYLYRILDAIDQPQLVHRILHYLLASPTEKEPVVEVPSDRVRKHMSMSRRKSLEMLAAFAGEEENPSPSLFNLVDLILLSVKSPNEDTLVATLRLVATLLRRHHSFAGSLIKTNDPALEGRRTVGALNAEMQQLFSLATSISDDPLIHESYENYAKDATVILESRLFVPSPRSSLLDGPADQPLEVRTDDAVFTAIMSHLERLFSNSVMTNLALTDVITSLASSNLVSLDGWLLVHPSNYQYADKEGPTEPKESNGDESNPADPVAAIKNAMLEPTWSEDSVPPIVKILRKLVNQIEAWRKEIPDFDVLIAARRELLHSGDTLMESRAPTRPPSRPSSQAPLSRAGPDQDHGSPRGRTADVIYDARLESPGPSNRDQTPASSPRRRTPSRPRPPQMADNLRRWLAKPYRVEESGELRPAPENGHGLEEQTDEQEPQAEVLPNFVTLGHILTNVVILYEFILELCAIVQVRSTLFEEAVYQ